MADLPGPSSKKKYLFGALFGVLAGCLVFFAVFNVNRLLQNSTGVPSTPTTNSSSSPAPMRPAQLLAEDELYLRNLVDTVNNDPGVRWKAVYSPYGETSNYTDSIQLPDGMKFNSPSWSAEKRAVFNSYLDELESSFQSDKMQEHLK